ncbi:SDR family NAD(P)-dependent oxidoreductase [Parabacteroides sp. APC149_11_2_Y6]
MSIKNYIKRGVKYILTGEPINHITANIVTLAPNELLKGRTALITGGTAGIGRAIAKAFLQSGADVVITGRTNERLVFACEELKQAGTTGLVYSICMDNRDVSSFSVHIDRISEKIRGNIDILVNNAGVLGGDIKNVTEEEYDQILNTNLKGVFFLSKFFGESWKEKGVAGNILNIASSSSLRPAVSAYTLTKWGIRGLTLGLGKNFAPYGITVNGIAPGPTATQMIIKKEADNITFPTNSLGRLTMPEEIANMAVFLVSDMGRSIIGDIVYMTGGSGLVTLDDVKYSF